MPRAIWNGEVIAESDDTVVIEGNHHFPLESVRREYLVGSDAHTVCAWTELVLDALEMANGLRRPSAGPIAHSDRGSQYTSLTYTDRLDELGIDPSVGSKGDQDGEEVTRFR